MSLIKFKRGLKVNLPSLQIAEPAFTTDSGELYIGHENGNIKISSIEHSNLIEDYKYLRSITKEPNGFVNKTDSSITYNLNTRTFTISGTFIYYNEGIKYQKTSVNESVQHGTELGVYFVKYRGGALHVGAAGASWSFETDTPVAVIIYNPTGATNNWAGPEAIILEERHAFMEWTTHQALHYNIGTYAKGSGFALNGTYVVASGSGGLSDVSYGVDSGIIVDEDLQHVLETLNDNVGIGNQYPIFYRIGSGSEWRWFVNNLPLLKNAADNILANTYSDGSWQLTPLTNNATYVNYYLCGIPYHSSSSGKSYRFIWIMGHAIFPNLASAEGESLASLDLAGLPFTEAVPFWQITMRRDNVFSIDSGRARIEAVKKIVGTKINSTYISGSPTSHNSLADRNVTGAHVATSVSLDPTNFNNILTNSDINAQLAFDKLDDHVHYNLSNYYITTNSGNDYSITTGRNLSSIEDGMSFRVKINTASLGSMTLNVDETGAVICKRANGAPVTEVYTNGVYDFVFNGADFILLGEISSDIIDGGSF